MNSQQVFVLRGNSINNSIHYDDESIYMTPSRFFFPNSSLIINCNMNPIEDINKQAQTELNRLLILYFAYIITLDGLTFENNECGYLLAIKLIFNSSSLILQIMGGNTITLQCRSLMLILSKILQVIYVYQSIHDSMDVDILSIIPNLLMVSNEIRYEIKYFEIICTFVAAFHVLVFDVDNSKNIVAICGFMIFNAYIYRQQIIHSQRIFQNQQYQKVLNACESRNLWKSRMQIIPLSVMFVEKNNEFYPSFVNKNLIKVFRTDLEDIMDTANVILSKIQFEVISVLKSRKGSKSGWNLKQNTRKSTNNCFEQHIEVQPKLNLVTILRTYVNNGYANQIDQTTNSLQLIGTHILPNETELNLTCQILACEIENEIMIVINDVSKQNDIQQIRIKENFQLKIVESFSHELRTPLNSAINYLQTSLNKKDSDNFIISQCIEPALISLQIQQFLINDIVDFSLYYSSALKIVVDQISVNELVSDVYKLFQQQIEMKGIQFIIECTLSQSEYIYTDYQRLMQIIVNLLQNSVKFSYQGIIKIKIKQTQSIIKFTITDNGIGIPTNIFGQVMSTLEIISQNKKFSKQKQWSGFGFIITQIVLNFIAPENRKCIQLQSTEHLGTKVIFYISNNDPQKLSKENIALHFQSASIVSSIQHDSLSPQRSQDKIKLKRGDKSPSSVVYTKRSDDKPWINYDKKIFIPASRDEVIDIPNEMVLASQQLQNESENCSLIFQCTCKKIMSVDDEVFNQKSIELLLKQLGYEVILAYNGRDAIEQIKALCKCCNKCKLLDTILMDYQMPILNGVQTTKELRKLMNNGEIPKISIIGLTAYTSQQDIEECLNAGMTHVLHKPFRIRQFNQLMQNT